jgi:predicted type IV restriction endonuclease
VSIDSLIPQVVKLADRARKYENVFKKSEAAVRSSLIEPFLKLWGWDVEDPAQVRPRVLNTSWEARLCFAWG